MRGRRSLTAALAGIAIFVTACGSSGKASTSSTSSVPSASGSGVTPALHAVGQRNEIFVDTRHTTAANGDVPARASRTLPTVIFYPAAGTPSAGASPNAPADLDDAPYPLIVFAHGLGSSGVEYQGLLERWAAAGFVVAAPKFPLTHRGTPGGVNPSDYQNQPADVSYVITAVLQASARRERTARRRRRSGEDRCRRSFAGRHHDVGPGGQHLLPRPTREGRDRVLGRQ